MQIGRTLIERHLGPNAFKEGLPDSLVGHFGETEDTHPYLRVLQALGEISCVNERLLVLTESMQLECTLRRALLLRNRRMSCACLYFFFKFDHSHH